MYYRKLPADAFWDLGGNLAMHFILSGPYQRCGCYGLTDDISNPDRNPKFTAIRELIRVSRLYTE